MKEKFHNFRGKMGLDVKKIHDDNVRFTMHLLACKLLHKCRKDEVPVSEKCVEGVQMN